MPAPDTLPQQQPTPHADLLNELGAQYREESAAVMAAIPAALKTSPVAGPGTSPGLTQTPAQPWQERPMDNRTTVGAKATRDKGIANAITGITNLVGQYEAKSETEKKRSLAVDLERTMQAQQGASEAQQALTLNPNDASAKMALDKNNRIIDAMLSDPKRRKAMGKALDINFVDPSQNNSPEHGALKEASASYAQQLAAKTPTTMQPNQAAIAKLQLAQSQAASTSKMIDTIVPAVIKAQTSDTNNQRTNQTRAEIAHETNQTRMQEVVYKADSDYDRTIASANIAAKSRAQVAGINADAAWDRTMQQVKGRMEVAKQRGADGKAMVGMMQGNSKIMLGYIGKLDDQQKQIDLLHVNKKMDDGTYNKKSAYIDGQRKAAQDLIQANQHYTNGIITSALGDSSNDGPTPGSASVSNSSDTPEPVGPTTDTDESQDNPDYYGTDAGTGG